MPTYGDITITIQVDGADVPEFLVEKDQAGKKVACWVPSQIGKEFEVVVNAGRRPRPWSAQVLVDGIKARNVAFVNEVARGCNIGSYKVSPTVYHDDALLQSSRMSHIGEIEIRCWYFDILGTKEDTIRTFEPAKKIHERTKKGIAEHIGLGNAVVRTPTFGYKAEWKECIATFVFRYRSLCACQPLRFTLYPYNNAYNHTDYLQAQGIAPSEPRPRSPLSVSTRGPMGSDSKNKPSKRSSSGSETKVKEEPLVISDNDEDDEEVQALLVKLEEVKARKRKQRQNAESVQKKIKREDKPKFLPGEVIDLT